MTTKIRYRNRAKRAAVVSPVQPPFVAERIELVPIASLKPYPRNPRKHSKRQIAKLSALIGRVGCLVPIVIDGDNNILAGHGRCESAKQLGLQEIPTIRAEHLTAAEARAFRIGDNRVPELSEWDEANLALELKELAVDLSFDLLDLTGFETSEIDLRIEGLDVAAADPLDEVPEPDRVTIAKPGDLFRLGEHRLLCGSSLLDQSYDVLLQGEKARVGFSDPPYNVKIDGHVGGLGKTKHHEFAMASGELDEQGFIAFLTPYLSLTRRHSVEGAIHFACMDAAHSLEILTAARSAGLSFKTTCTWAKTNAGMGSFYRQQTEFVHVFKNGGDDVPHINNIQLGKYGRYRTTLWTYAGVNTFRRGRMEDLGDHPTVKPQSMVADAIKDCSKRGDIVLDAFCGSGTTIIAAQRTGRRAHAIELDPIYVDVALRRWEKATKAEAIHAETGLTFAELSKAREEAGRD